ncbi:MAG: hypothetical protein J6330_10305 [Clostridia bacterium]|nr:hypothetical protein [Clostridia bacterium]
MKKLLSTLLAFLMAVGVFTAVFASQLTVEASNSTAADEEIDSDAEDMSIDILKVVYKTPEDKLKDMKMRIENDNYQLYVRAAYGEIALKDKRTGQILFSNPYDIASTKGSADTKAELMSQIILQFTTGSKTTVYNSYTEAAKREQIVVKNIKNGVRVEYTLGKTQTRWLVPQMITNERFQEMILDPIRENTQDLAPNQRDFILGKFENGFYSEKNINDPTLSKSGRDSILAQWPILKKYPSVWVLGTDTKDREFAMLEGYIKTYAPDYSYEELDYDHDITEYEASATSQPLFRMAIEYTLQEDGLTQRMSAKSISFDENVYTLDYLQVNPWFGCGNGTNKGFTFIPDGSGTLTRFEDVSKPLTITSNIYGPDYAYYTTDPAHRQTMRLPVYGVVENYSSRTVKAVTVELPEDEWYIDEFGYWIKTKTEMRATVVTDNRGYFAIMTEGDALAQISTVNGAGSTHVYSTVQTKYFPRPTDSYSLREAMGAAADDAMWTVAAKRKYTGNYTVRYFMLSDEVKAEEYQKSLEEQGKTDDSKFYTADYMGMVNACRNYLEKTGVIERLKAEDLQSDIPLVLETLGTVETEDQVLSVPVTVKKPLTSFDDVKLMYEQLYEAGISNLKFKLTGYANGGLYSDVPYKLKWEKKVGGNKGFTDLMEYAAEKGIEIFPEFEFTYLNNTSMFDGFSYKKHAAKTMDNRYPRTYYYDPAYQMTRRWGPNIISSSVFEYFYENFAPKLLKYAPSGISVGTLGSDLNSDFDKKDPYNREDSKSLVTDLLAQMSNDFGKVMVNGGNLYSVRYADYILAAPLDSSQYLKTSEAIPFMGMVLHGYVQFSGEALNMAGDIDYEMLKAIENGAIPYFLLAYENTDILKKDSEYKKMYSVNFKIWAESGLVEKYKILNEALKDVQDKIIVNHEFIKGVRVLTAAEIKEREEDEQRRLDEESASRALEEAKTAEDVTTVPEDEETTEAEVDAEIESPEETTDTEAEATDTDPEETTTGSEDSEPAEETAKDEVNPEDIVNNGKIVRVTYEGGKVFVLNYNNYAVTVDGYDGVISALGFVSYIAQEEVAEE